MTDKKGKSGKVIEFDAFGDKADARREARREARAKQLRNKFSAARRDAESKSEAAAKLKNLFKHPKSDSGKKP